MNIMSIKDASLKWDISIRRINFLCNEGRIEGARKIAGAWLIPSNANKPCDRRLKSGGYVNWRKNTNMNRDDFETNLKNLKGTFAVESMMVSESGINNLKRIEKGEVLYTDVIEELKKKYSQRI